MPEPNVPTFTLPMGMRCHHPQGASPLQVCGAAAAWMRPGPLVLPPPYFCDVHRERGDVPLPESYIFRRVHVDATLLIASASRLSGPGQLEAIARLDQALGAIGVLPDWLGVRSTLGRYNAPQVTGGRRTVLVRG